MPARGRSCATCDHRHEVPSGIPGIVAIECRADVPAVQMTTTAGIGTSVDMMNDTADALDDLGTDVQVTVEPFDAEVERWPHVQLDDWCGRWRREPTGDVGDVLPPGSFGEA